MDHIRITHQFAAIALPNLSQDLSLQLLHRNRPWYRIQYDPGCLSTAEMEWEWMSPSEPFRYLENFFAIRTSDTPKVIRCLDERAKEAGPQMSAFSLRNYSTDLLAHRGRWLINYRRPYTIACCKRLARHYKLCLVPLSFCLSHIFSTSHEKCWTANDFGCVSAHL